MKMRMPAIPLITIDPYFSVWSNEKINTKHTVHWTGKQNAIIGIVEIDGKSYRFLGDSKDEIIEQTCIEIEAMSTTVYFKNNLIKLKAKFTSPLLITDLYYSSRPCSYLELSYESTDGKEHSVFAKIYVTEELVLSGAGEGRALSYDAKINNGTVAKMGNGEQNVLGKSGDMICIDWGYFYLSAEGDADTKTEVINSLYSISLKKELNSSALFVFAFDDINSITYFKKPLNAYWKKDGKTIEQAIDEAIEDYSEITAKCSEFSHQLEEEAILKGGEKYAELLLLAYRQVMAAHKLVIDENGEILYISKECSSNGCAATVDVTYPSAPMFLKYNPELLKAMLHPIFRYAKTDAWKFDFAPHDVGEYPILNGQAYNVDSVEGQMPVEECGNIIILIAEICKIENSTDFAIPYLDLLDKWSKYLVEYGNDPQNQLCTDDFAGHLAHNVNLAIKAIMGIAGYSKILERLGKPNESEQYFAIAKEYAVSLCERAVNSDGSYRLAFDRPETFSLKYNSVWDKLWGTKLFGDEFYRGEIKRYKSEALPYGVPLDNREKYTKTDWMLWIACLTEEKEDFEFFTKLLWNAFNTTRNRAPMSDWFYADTTEKAVCPFINRTVQGGLFLRLLLP